MIMNCFFSQTLSSAAVGSIVGLQSEEILQVASEYEVKVKKYMYMYIATIPFLLLFKKSGFPFYFRELILPLPNHQTR